MFVEAYVGIPVRCECLNKFHDANTIMLYHFIFTL